MSTVLAEKELQKQLTAFDEVDVLVFAFRMRMVCLQLRIQASRNFDLEAKQRAKQRKHLSVMQRPLDAGYWQRKRQEIRYIPQPLRDELKERLRIYEKELKGVLGESEEVRHKWVKDNSAALFSWLVENHIS